MHYIGQGSLFDTESHLWTVQNLLTYSSGHFRGDAPGDVILTFSHPFRS